MRRPEGRLAIFPGFGRAGCGGERGDETIAEKRDAARLALEAEAKKHALVQAVIANFPSAKILDIRTPDAIAQEVQADALPEVDEEWDPFEDD